MPRDDVARGEYLAGEPLVADDADAERSRVEHQAVVAAVADRDDAMCVKAFDERSLGEGLVASFENDHIARECGKLAARGAESVGGDDVNPNEICHGWEERAHLGDEFTVARNSPVEVADEVGELKPTEAGDVDVNHARAR